MGMTTTPDELFERSIMLYGPEGFRRLQGTFVAVVGLGGVGAYAAEALVRAGIGHLRIIDCDVIKATDVNRQLIALAANLGRSKVDAAAERLLSINPALQLDARQAFFHTDTADELITSDLHFVIDAIDSLNPKAALLTYCRQHNVPVISALGASSRTDPFQIRMASLDDTSVCPLARALRRHLRSRKLPTDLPVIYSTEPPATAVHGNSGATETHSEGPYERGRKRRALPSISTIPGIIGLMAANHVLFTLLREESASKSVPSERSVPG